MAVRHFFHHSLLTYSKFCKSPSLQNSVITKQCVYRYWKAFPLPNYFRVSPITCHICVSNFCSNSQKSLNIDAEIVMSPTQMISTIQQEASATNKMVFSISEEAICKYIKILEDINMPPANIMKLAISYPDILWVKENKWESILTFLSSYGLSNDQLCQILENFPNILQLSPGNLNLVIDSIRKIGIYDRNLPLIITSYPEIFLVSPTAILKRSKQLRSLFKTDDAILLIRKSPLILVEDWENVEKKFHYVFAVMGITQPQMRYSHLFSYSLEHIQTRHLWVERCGFFKKLKAKEDKKLNPRLSMIIDSSDQEFAKKFGNMTLKEYKTFYKLVQSQIDNSEDSDLEDE